MFGLNPDAFTFYGAPGVTATRNGVPIPISDIISFEDKSNPEYINVVTEDGLEIRPNPNYIPRQPQPNIVTQPVINAPQMQPIIPVQSFGAGRFLNGFTSNVNAPLLNTNNSMYGAGRFLTAQELSGNMNNKSTNK